MGDALLEPIAHILNLRNIAKSGVLQVAALILTFAFEPFCFND